MRKEEKALALQIAFGVALGETKNINICNEEINLKNVYVLLKKHDLAHLLACYLLNVSNFDNAELNKALLKEMSLSAYRFNNLKIVKNTIKECLNKQGVPFILLKGAVLREFYNEPWLRTSSDIDLLVNHCDLEKVSKELIKNYNFTLEDKAPNSISLRAENGVLLEVLTQMEGDKQDKSLLNMLWDTAIKKVGYEYAMPNELFYFYHIAHMAKHFKGGGCGIRAFIDLILIKNNLNYDVQKVDKLLEDYDLKKFETVVSALANSWQNGIMNNEYEEVENYVLYGGTFGTMEQHIATNRNSKSKFKYLLKRIFMPYAELKKKYKILEKHKWLTPFYEVVRWFSLLNAKSIKRSKRELRGLKTFDKNKAESVEKLLSNLGLNN